VLPLFLCFVELLLFPPSANVTALHFFEISALSPCVILGATERQLMLQNLCKSAQIRVICVPIADVGVLANIILFPITANVKSEYCLATKH
jgi:hypothetical protein